MGNRLAPHSPSCCGCWSVEQAGEPHAPAHLYWLLTDVGLTDQVEACLVRHRIEQLGDGLAVGFEFVDVHALEVILDLVVELVAVVACFGFERVAELRQVLSDVADVGVGQAAQLFPQCGCVVTPCGQLFSSSCGVRDR